MDNTNTIDADNGNSTADQVSLPTTTSVLDKSRSLFGKPSAVQSEPVREPTPEVKEAESTAVTDPPVSMETEEKEVAVDADAGESGKTSTQDASPTEEVDTAPSPLLEKSDSPEPVEESFEKKVVSMDTSAVGTNQEEAETSGTTQPDLSDEKAEEDVCSKSSNDLVIDDDEYDDDEEEEEVPKKKAKRQAYSEEDEEEKSDEQQMGAESPEQVENEESDVQQDSAAKSLETVSESNGGGEVSSEADETKAKKAETKAFDKGHCTTIADDEVEVDDIDVGATNEDGDVKNDDAVAADNDDEVVDDDAEIQVKSVEAGAVNNAANFEEKVAEQDDNVHEEDAEVAEEVGATAEDNVEASGNNDEAPEDDGEAPKEEGEAPEEVTPKQVLEPRSTTRSARARKAQTMVSTPSSTTSRRGGRGRKNAVEPQQEEPNEGETETPKRGRASRRVQNDSVQEEHNDAETLEEEEEEEEAPPPKRGRARRSAVPNTTAEEEPNETSASAEPIAEATPTRGARSRRSAASSTPVTSASRSTRGKARKSQASQESSGEPVNSIREDGEEEDAPEETVPKTASRTPRARKSTAKIVEQQNEDNGDIAMDDGQATTSSRRSARAKATPKATPVAENKRTPARGRKRVSISEEVPEEAAQTSTKRGRGSIKKGPSSSSKKDEYDPYDLDTEMEHHPEPLKNIHMEVQHFGAVKYAKAGQSESKYSMTEKAAEKRIADLHTSPTIKNKRSLADMTPGREKTSKRASTGTGRRSKAKKEQSENDVEMEDVSQADSSGTPSVGRGRKRKSEGYELTAPASKKDAQVVLRVLNDEEQLQADHPQDGNEPHSVGARVYVNFQKIFYPAVVFENGLGRFKVQFTNDKVVKEVPNSAIIPLRDLVPGKTALYDEKEALLNAGPDDISAEEWFKGLVTITILNEEGEPTDETRAVDWKELSFEQAEWREYIKVKEQSAASVATSNITAIGHTSRVRKPVSIAHSTKPVVRRKKGADPILNDASEAQMEDDDEDKLLPMKEEAIGKNIFSGKVFMLTSANRSSVANVPSMFKKKNLMDFITQNGGIVTEQHSSFQEQYSDREPMLISDTYYRTHKYLAALARGIPCVSNIWLQACGEKGECVDHTSYILPAGASIFDDYPEMPAPENPGELLKEKRIYIHSTHSAREVTQTGPGGTFIEIWKPILELLGATVIEGDYEKVIEDGVKFDVALVDGTFRDEVLEYATDIGASKVTSEWVIQTIILGKAPEPNAHPKFDPNRLHHRTRYD